MINMEDRVLLLETHILNIFIKLFPCTPFVNTEQANKMIIEKIERDYDTTRLIEKGVDIK